MRGWLGDLFRTIGALWFWNLRKTVYVVRGRRGDCPCHNPSDSGRPRETRCEAVTYWNKPRRFARRVCPRLVEVEPEVWRCAAHPSEVRPFWGRWLLWHAAAAGGAVVAAGLLLFATMRTVGFEVTLRQIFWPRAWPELRAVRAEYFRKQAQEHYLAGRFREAANALNVAYEMDPGNYEAGVALTEFYQVGRPELVDSLFRHLMRQHPERRSDTAQLWLRSLLGRTNLTGVAELAADQLRGAGDDAGAWTHAIVFASRVMKRPELLDGPATDEKVPESVRNVLQLEARVRRLERAEAVALLLRESLPAGFPYARLHRVELLLDYGEGFEALEMLRAERGQMGGRDVARLTLAAHAVMRNRAALERDVRYLLSPGQQENASGLAVVAQHLVRYPEPALLDLCLEALPALAALPAAQGLVRDRAIAAVYCAAMLGGRREHLAGIRALLSDAARDRATLTLEEVLARRDWAPFLLLSLVKPMSLELQYALLERLWADRSGGQ